LQLHSDEERLQEASNMLYRLAEYVNHARLDELTHVHDPQRSLVNAIELIEQQGIFQLLCDIRIGDNLSVQPLDPSVSRGLDIIRCSLTEPVSRDNRNYIVFYTLSRLLRSISR
jgi:hypothetical protein